MKDEKKEKLLSNILSRFFDWAERYDLDRKSVSKAVKEVQYLFRDDEKSKERCFTCEED